MQVEWVELNNETRASILSRFLAVSENMTSSEISKSILGFEKMKMIWDDFSPDMKTAIQNIIVKVQNKIQANDIVNIISG